MTSTPASTPVAAITLEPVVSWPNVVTVIRTVVSMVLGVLAIREGSLELLAVAYVIYWFGDSLDGQLARRLDQETKFGAVFDIICDRACTSLLCVGLLAQMTEIWPVVIVFLLSFMALDTMLSLSFLCWPSVISPNYFYDIDRRVYALNWSHPAKAVNTAGVVLMVVLSREFEPLLWVALVVACTVVAVKIWSSARVIRLLSS